MQELLENTNELTKRIARNNGEKNCRKLLNSKAENGKICKRFWRNTKKFRKGIGLGGQRIEKL